MTMFGLTLILAALVAFLVIGGALAAGAFLVLRAWPDRKNRMPELVTGLVLLGVATCFSVPLALWIYNFLTA